MKYVIYGCDQKTGQSNTTKIFDGTKEAVNRKTQAIVEETCPKCCFGKASFYTMQMRSADEGQTVFYSCMKCSHKWKQNN